MNNNIKQAVSLLNEGKLVAFPTETVYGLGADAENDLAVASIFEAKGRPSFNPLIVHVSDIEMAEKYALFNDNARLAYSKFCPGAFTMVLPRNKSSKLSYLVTAGLDTVAIRIPKHPLIQDILKSFKKGIAAPSANASGTVSPTTAEHVFSSLGSRVDLILDGGSCEVGLESTIVDFSEERPAILRHGFVTKEDLEQVFSTVDINDKITKNPKAPGMLASHYAPSLKLRINVETPDKGEAFLGFGDVVCDANLSEKSDLREAASNLFAYIRMLDDNNKYSGIAVAPIPEYGLGLAINDRLKRAAAPKN
ncbi:MAG: L-threonylcarbamoyladenylate synthase [Alphaproteobacteria bacterium]